jgi:hypothetical protein
MGRGEAHTGLWWGNLMERAQLEGLDLDWKTILKWILKCDGDIDWIDMLQDRDRWRALVKAVMNLWVP